MPPVPLFTKHASLCGRPQNTKALALAAATALHASKAEKLGDRALAAFIIIQAMLKRSRRLTQFSKRPDLNARMPDYSVSTLCLTQALLGVLGAELLYAC